MQEVSLRPNLLRVREHWQQWQSSTTGCANYIYMPAQEAAAQNERKRSAESAQSVLSRMQAARPDSGRAAGPPPPRVTELTPAEAAKEEGNAALKRGDVAQARRAAHRGRGAQNLQCRMLTCHPASDFFGYRKLKGRCLCMHLGSNIRVLGCL